MDIPGNDHAEGADKELVPMPVNLIRANNELQRTVKSEGLMIRSNLPEDFLGSGNEGKIKRFTFKENNEERPLAFKSYEQEGEATRALSVWTHLEMAGLPVPEDFILIEEAGRYTGIAMTDLTRGWQQILITSNETRRYILERVYAHNPAAVHAFANIDLKDQDLQATLGKQLEEMARKATRKSFLFKSGDIANAVLSDSGEISFVISDTGNVSLNNEFEGKVYEGEELYHSNLGCLRCIRFFLEDAQQMAKKIVKKALLFAARKPLRVRLCFSATCFSATWSLKSRSLKSKVHKMASGSLLTVMFALAPLETEAELLRGFSNPDERFANTMRKVFPELMAAVMEAETDEERLAFCKEFSRKTRGENNAGLIAAKEEIELDWAQVSERYLALLAEHMETNWPAEKNITGYISIMPICPRFLDTYSFNIDFRKPTAEARVTIAHEILHFLWFKKWKEVFPESKRDEYEAPHLVWRLSEIMDPVILQCHPEIKALIRPKEWGYEAFKKIKIGDVGLSPYFAKAYSDCVREKKSFADTMKTVWVEAEKHRVALEQF